MYRAEGTTLHHYYTYAGTGPGYRPWGEDRDYILNSNLGLRIYITHHLHASLKYDYNKTRYSFGEIKDSSYVLSVGLSL